VVAVVAVTLPASHRYRSVVLAAIALVQCYATRTQNGCAPLSYYATMAECRALAEDYRRFDSKALNATGLPAVVSYRCIGTNR
jgi:predicted aminopeptidase